MSSYLERIRNHPMLEVGEERLLARRDPAAAHKLITSPLRLVAKPAMSYRRYDLPIGEIVSEGNTGLLKSVERFEPDGGFRLATYAMWWIKASVQEYAVRSWLPVRIGTTANQKRLFFNLRRAQARILAIGDEDLRSDQVQELSAQLGVPEQDVAEMNPRMRGELSLDVPLREDGREELQDRLVDECAGQESTLVSEEEQQNRLLTLRDALMTLAPRERRIFEARRLDEDPIKLEELAIEFHLTRERVRQIEVRVFENVRKAVRTNLAKREASKHGQDATAALPERRSRPFPQGSRIPRFEQQRLNRSAFCGMGLLAAPLAIAATEGYGHVCLSLALAVLDMRIDRGPDAREQFLVAKGLGQIAPDPVPQSPRAYSLVRIRRDQDGRNRAAGRNEAQLKIRARDAGHLHVGDQASGAMTIAGLQEVLGALEPNSAIAERLQEARDGLAHRLVVVDDRDH